MKLPWSTVTLYRGRSGMKIAEVEYPSKAKATASFNRATRAADTVVEVLLYHGDRCVARWNRQDENAPPF